MRRPVGAHTEKQEGLMTDALIQDSAGRGFDRTDADALARAMNGSILHPSDEGYDEARTIWNAMIDRRPALIARCESTADVKRSVDFAREFGLLLSIHGGGHNIAGNAVCDDGLMIDLSPMNFVRVDTEAKTAAIGPGATLGDVDRETLKHGLATPVGINSTTGIAGLTLGGGFGWLSRTLGLTADNLIGAEVVTANGEVQRVNENEHADLFWALRGGSGNFGVVTEFNFKLHEVGPDLLSGLVVYPLEQAKEALQKYREIAAGLGDETSVWPVLRQAPPLPFLPEEVHGKPVVVFALCHAGDPEEGRQAIEPIRHLGTPYGEHIGVQPFADWQQAFDPLLTPGARNYWKSHNLLELADGLIDLLIRYVAEVPSPHCEIFVGQLGGQINRVAPDATAYCHRDAEFVINVHGRWETEAEDNAGIKWSRDFYRDAEQYATGGVYVNFMTAEETERIGAAYGSNWDRLAEIKRRYDPENLFRMNQNIQPG
jgi:FAD/FMN-containing dehydrogenase